MAPSPDQSWKAEKILVKQKMSFMTSTILLHPLPSKNWGHSGGKFVSKKLCETETKDIIPCAQYVTDNTKMQSVAL